MTEIIDINGKYAAYKDNDTKDTDTKVIPAIPDCGEMNTNGPPSSHKSPEETDPGPREPKLLPQLLAVVMACWINLASGASLGYATPVLKKLAESSSSVRIDEWEGSWMASLIMMGAMPGGVISGVAISYGRKNALWITAPPLCSAWGLLVFARNVWYLYGAHFIMGLCLGIISDASQIYVSETASKKWRGALGCIPVLMFNLGTVACYVAGAFLSWWNLAAFGACVTVPSLILPYFLPESPVYLVVKGRLKEAGDALRSLRGSEFDINTELQELRLCEKVPRSTEGLERQTLIQKLKNLWKLKWCNMQDFMVPFMHTAIIRVLSRFCGIRAILCYTHTIFSHSDSNADNDINVIASGVVQLVATFAACLLLDRLGRRVLLVVSQAVMAVCLLGFGVYLFFYNGVSVDRTSFLGYIPLICILIYIIANSIGLGPVSGIIIGEIVPQRHRSSVSSITGSMSWFSAFVITKTFYELRNCLNLYGAIWVYSAVCMAGVLYTLIMVPETRGLTQFEIDTLFQKKSEKIDNKEQPKGFEVNEVVVH